MALDRKNHSPQASTQPAPDPNNVSADTTDSSGLAQPCWSLVHNGQRYGQLMESRSRTESMGLGPGWFNLLWLVADG